MATVHRYDHRSSSFLASYRVCISPVVRFQEMADLFHFPGVLELPEMAQIVGTKVETIRPPGCGPIMSRGVRHQVEEGGYDRYLRSTGELSGSASGIPNRVEKSPC